MYYGTKTSYDAEASRANTGGDTVLVYPATSTPLTFVVFSDAIKVMLPQAHTASQLFAVERGVNGIELEAATGVPASSQLFFPMVCPRGRR